MTYVVREITDARAMAPTGFASFASMDEAVAFVADAFDVLFGEEEDGEYDAIVRPKGKKFFTPYQINISEVA